MAEYTDSSFELKCLSDSTGVKTIRITRFSVNTSDPSHLKIQQGNPYEKNNMLEVNEHTQQMFKNMPEIPF